MDAAPIFTRSRNEAETFPGDGNEGAGLNQVEERRDVERLPMAASLSGRRGLSLLTG